MARLFIGPFSPYLEERLIDEIASIKQSDPFCPVAVIVPTAPIRRRLFSLLARRGSWVNLHFFTFLTLALSVLKTDENRSVRIPPRSAQRLLVADSLALMDPEDQYARYFHTFESCRGRLVSLFSRFTAYRVDREQGRSGIERSVLDAYRHYREHKEQQGFMDGEDVITAAIDRLAETIPGDLPGIFSLYGFYDLNAIQQEVVRILDEKARLAIFSPGGFSREAGEYCARTADLYERLSGGHEGASSSYAPAPGDPVFLSIARDLFRHDTPRRHEARGLIEFITAPGGHGEARAVGLSILRARELDAGLAWSDIGITAKNIEDVADGLRNVFDQLSIPVSFDGGSPAAFIPEVRFFAIMLSAIRNGLARNDVAFLLASACFAWPGLPPADEPWIRDNAHLIETIARRASVVTGASDWERALTATVNVPPDGADDYDEGEPPEGSIEGRTARYLSCTRRVIMKFISDLSLIPDEAGPGEYQGLFSDLIDTYCLPTDTGTRADFLTEVLDELSGASMVRKRITKDECLALLDRAIAEGRIPPPVGADAVFVSDVMGIRGLSFDLLFIMGMNETVFPGLPSRDPFLTDETKEALGLGTSALQNAEDRYLFTLAVASAKKRLVICRRRSDNRGRMIAPSVFVREILSRITVDGAEVNINDAARKVGRDYPRLIQTERDLSTYRGWDMGVSLCLTWPAPEDRNAVRGLVNRSAFLRHGIAAQVERSPDRPFGVYDGRIGRTPEVLEALLPLSAVKLETYACCPFDFFMRYVIGAPEMLIPEEELDAEPRDLGLLYHRTLSFLFHLLKEKRLFPVVSGNRVTTGGLIKSAVIKKIRGALTGRVPALVLKAREERAVEALTRLVEREAERDLQGYLPEHLEAVFGADTHDGAPVGEFRLDIGGSILPFIGRIDRIDVNRDEGLAFVIDYKKRRPAGSLLLQTRIKNGRHLQLPLYIEAAPSIVGGGTTVSGGALVYIEEDDEDRCRETLSEQEYRELREAVIGHIARSVADIEEGEFSPRREDSCGYCAYGDICRGDWQSVNRMRRNQTRPERRLDEDNDVDGR